jgi:hypothetical protein
MSHQMHLKRLVARVYQLLLGFYPSPFRTSFGDEMQAVFTSVLEEQDGESPLRLFWRELRHWPGSVLKAHLHGRRRNMASNENPLPRREWLAAMIIFLLPLLSLFAVTGISLPVWTNYIILVLFWGSILFALGLGIAKRLPAWSLSYFGFLLMLGQVFTPVFPSVASWMYPQFLETFGPMSRWPVSISLLYSGIFEFIGALTVLFGALVLVNLLRLFPYTRSVWKRIRTDWTQLSFLMYGGLVFYIILAFDEYRYEDLWKFGAWACLALGTWLYLRGKGHLQRILALLGGTTAAFWIVALAKWMLIPLQKWPTGYPIAPSVTSLWVETGSTLLSWLFFLGNLCAPALMSWLPPLPEPIPVDEENPVNIRTA